MARKRTAPTYELWPTAVMEAAGSVLVWAHKAGHWFVIDIQGDLRKALFDRHCFCAEASVKRLFEKQDVRFSWRRVSLCHNNTLRLPLSEPFPYPDPRNIISPEERERRFPISKSATARRMGITR